MNADWLGAVALGRGRGPADAESPAPPPKPFVTVQSDARDRPLSPMDWRGS